MLAAGCARCLLLAVLAACCARCLLLAMLGFRAFVQRTKNQDEKEEVLWLAKERDVLQRESCATKIAELCYKDSQDSAGEQAAASATKGTPLERHPLNLNPKR